MTEEEAPTDNLAEDESSAGQLNSEELGDFPDEFDIDYAVFQDEDGDWHGKDDRGEFRLDAGSQTPPDPDDYNYEPCGAVLRHSYDRYGEARYCEGMAVSNFSKHHDIDREYDDFCKHHQMRGRTMEYIKEEQSEHLAFAASFETLFEYLDAHKKILAVEMFASLLDESKYDYDPEFVVKEIDVSESTIFEDADSTQVDFPVPTERTVRGKSLYFAALNYVQMENIMEEQFRVAANETGPDGQPLAMGERTTVVSVTDEGNVVEDKDEHHLNLPLSRIQKDYERHLKVGGVEIVGDTAEVSDDEARQWVFKVEAEQDDAAPEATSDDNPMTDLDTPDGS